MCQLLDNKKYYICDIPNNRSHLHLPLPDNGELSKPILFKK